MRGTGDRPLRCEPTMNRKKNGETKRIFASRRATASLAISSPFATLIFFFRLDATSNPKLENFPYQKKARDDDAGRRSGRCRPASREGFSKESARSIDDARSERRRPFPFLPGGGFLVVVRRAVFGVEKTLGRKISLFCPFFCGFFFGKKKQKDVFRTNRMRFFSDRHPIAHPTPPPGETRHRTPPPRNAAARERNDDASTTRDRNGFRGGGGSSARGKQSGNTPFTLSFTRELIQKKGRRRVAFFFGNWEIKNLKKKYLVVERCRKDSRSSSVYRVFPKVFALRETLITRRRRRRRRKRRRKQFRCVFV